jgi:hypothetical protein
MLAHAAFTSVDLRHVEGDIINPDDIAKKSEPE